MDSAHIVIFTTMVVNNNPIISKLIEIGFSEYESRAYLALLKRNPSSAYEVGKLSGIPTSKIYEVISRLCEKGIISPVEQEGTRKYIPADPSEFLDEYKSRIDQTLDSLKRDLSRLRDEEEPYYLWNIVDYDYFISKARRMVEKAENTVLLSVWKEEMALLQDLLEKAVKKGVKVASVHFGEPESVVGLVFKHPIENTIFLEKSGRTFVLICDSKEVLLGTIYSKGEIEGAWSRNPGFVTLAEDYVKHDIYIMKIVHRCERELKRRFGEGFELLRDVFNDEEMG